MQNDDAPMIALLRSSGAKRPIHLLAYYGDTDVLAAMPEILADPAALASEVHCAGAETRELTEYFFAAGMNPSHRDWQGSTLLHEQARDDELRPQRKAGNGFLSPGARCRGGTPSRMMG